MWLRMEHFFLCPCCGAEISTVIDESVHRDTYIEDCEVCCNPLEIGYVLHDEAIERFIVKGLDE